MIERDRASAGRRRHRAPDDEAPQRERRGERAPPVEFDELDRTSAIQKTRGPRFGWPRPPSSAIRRGRARPDRRARRRWPGLKRSSSSGMSSARTRLRGMPTSSFDSSSTYAAPRSARYARSSARRQSSSGRTIAPLRGCIAARPRDPAPRSEAQQKRLGLIVARVAERHDVGAELHARALEERVARRARGVLDAIAARARAIAADVRAIDDDRPAERLRDAPRTAARRGRRPREVDG